MTISQLKAALKKHNVPIYREAHPDTIGYTARRLPYATWRGILVSASGRHVAPDAHQTLNAAIRTALEAEGIEIRTYNNCREMYV